MRIDLEFKSAGIVGKNCPFDLRIEARDYFEYTSERPVPMIPAVPVVPNVSRVDRSEI